MKPFTLVLAAGVPVPVQAGGDFFYLDSCPLGGLRVQFFGPGNLERDVLLDAAIEGTRARLLGGFSALKLTSTLAQTIRYYVARGDVGVNRFSGSSDVTDRAARLLGTLTAWVGKNRTGSPGFMGSAQITPANSAHIQLWNPAASGVTLYVDRFSFSVGAANNVDLYRHNAALGAGHANGSNKTVGGAASAAEIRSFDQVGASGTVVWLMRGRVDELQPFPFEEPIIVPAGQSIILRTAVATQLRANFEWREV